MKEGGGEREEDKERRKEGVNKEEEKVGKQSKIFWSNIKDHKLCRRVRQRNTY